MMKVLAALAIAAVASAVKVKEDTYISYADHWSYSQDELKKLYKPQILYCLFVPAAPAALRENA